MSAPSGVVDRRDHVDAAAVLVMLALTLSWGFNGVAAKISNSGYSPIFVALLRSAIAAALVYLWCRLRGIAIFNRDGTLAAGLAAGFLFGIEFVLMFLAFDFTSVGRVVLLVNTMPFWVLIGAHFLLGEHMTRRKLGGVTLAFAGVALVFSDKLSQPGPQALLGDLMSLTAGVAWAATTLVIKRSRLATVSAEKLLLYQLAVSAVMTVPLLPLSLPLVRTPSLLADFATAFQSVYIVAFTYLVWFWLMRRYPAAGLASFAFLTPVFGVLFGGLILSEPLSQRLILSLALIAGGLVVVNRPAR